MRVFDCFPLFNELDLLELRLNELWHVVDVFVIVEARQTFTGNSKPLNFAENEARFAKYLPKIRYLTLDAFPEGMSNWGKEEYQRNWLKRGLTDAKPDDVVILSDLDEIPRAEAVQRIVQKGIRHREVYCLSLAWYQYYMNVDVKVRWERQGPRLVCAGDVGRIYALRRILAPTKGFLRNLIRQIKSSRVMNLWLRRILVQDAGWHFTWMGGAEAIALKGSSIPTHSHLQEGPKTTSWAKQRLAAALDNPDGYEIVELDDSFPRFVRDNTELFAKYILA